MPKSFITLVASWGNDDVIVELKLSKRDWTEIQNGAQQCRLKNYYYEGKRYQSAWHFNFPNPGDVEISYSGEDEDDYGGVGYIGRITDLLPRSPGTA